MKSTSKSYEAKSRELAHHILEEVRSIEPAAAEAMEFWRAKKHHHHLYYRARRDLMRDLERVLAAGIQRFFTHDEIDSLHEKA